MLNGGLIIENTNLPKESESQKLGEYAKLTFECRHPVSWRKEYTDGGTDFGLDVQIQIIDQGHCKNVFNAQIKGSAQNKLSEDGKFISQSLNISTLNYYARIENPVMLIFADLAQNKDPRNCFAYYIWIHEEIDRLREGKPNLDHLNKELHTFRIPVENVLDYNLNVLPFLNARLDKKRAFDGFYKSFEKKYTDPINKITQIGMAFETNKIAIDTILNNTENPWLDAPKGTFAFELKRSAHLLENHNAEMAKTALERLNKRIGEATSHELSELYYQCGYLAGLVGKHRESIEFYKKAHLISEKIKKYHLAYLEAQIPYEYDDDAKVDQLIAEIDQFDDAKYIYLKAKLLAIKKLYTEAFDLIKDQDEKDSVVIKALIYFLSGAYDDCTAFAYKGLKEYEVSDRQQLSLRSLITRSFFYLGFKNAHQYKIIPFSGLPEMNTELLKRSWEELILAWELAKNLGYPHDVETMVDTFLILGAYFDEIGIVKRHLLELAEIRPHVKIIQEGLLQLSMYSGDFQTASRQLSKLPDTIENIIVKILIASNRKNKVEVVTLCEQIFLDIIEQKPENFDLILAISAECANDILEYTKRDKYLQELQQLPNAESILAVYDFIVQVEQQTLKKSEAVDNLYFVYKKGHACWQLLVQLIHNLNPNKDEHAHRIIEVANEISKQRDLFEKEYIIVCLSNITINEWQALLHTARIAQKRFLNARFKAFEALGLDGVGETGLALNLLDKILNGEEHDPAAIEIFVSIAIRCGHVEKAKKHLTQLLVNATEKDQKLHLLRVIFNIELSIDPLSDQLLNISSRYGQLCNQNDEHEEGIFLVLFFRATLNIDKEIKAEKIGEFQKRLATYISKFPDSKILKSVSVEENAPEKLILQLEKISGFTNEKRQWYQRNENLLKRQHLPVPYILKTKLLLNVTNHVNLWEISKLASKECAQYKLTISDKFYNHRDIKRFNNRLPLIDDISLVVLFDLGLLESLFKIFSKIAIAKCSIISFQKLIQSSFYGPDVSKAKDILEILASYVDRIIQPSSKKVEEDSFFEDLDQLKTAYDQKSHLFYSDDFITRIYICGEDHFNDTICTLDIIEILKNYEKISPKEAAEKYALLAEFGVGGVPVFYRDILTVIEPDLPLKNSVEEYYQILDKHISFNSFISYLWCQSGDYLKSVGEIGNFLAFMISEQDGVIVNTNIIVAIWYCWFRKVQFIYRSEKNKLHFFSRSFMSAALALQAKGIDNKAVWEKAWRIYNDIINHVYGNEMNRSIENQSKTVLADMIANFEIEQNVNLYALVSLGLIDGTSDSSLFKDAYTERYIHRSKQK